MDGPDEVKKTGWQKALFILKVLEIRLRFVAILVITALAVGYWDNIVNYWERWTRKPMSEGAQTESEFEYTCGMHPFVVRDKPGKCPICGMDLSKRKRGEAGALQAGTLARVQISPERIMQAGVQVEPVEYRLLTRTVTSYGVVEADETRVSRIALRFPGRVDELFVNAVGMEVKKGDPLARVYSPKFLATSLEYVQALEAQRRANADAQAGAETKQMAASIVNSTRQRLLLAGFTPEQVAALEKGERPSDHVTFYSPLAGVVLEKNVRLGDVIEEGMTLYTVADLSVVWAQMEVPEADVSGVRVGMPVEVNAVAWPGVIFPGNVDLIYPVLNTETRSLRARVSVSNKDGKLRPGMFVTAAVRRPAGRYGVIGGENEPKVGAAEKVNAAGGDYPLDYCVVTGAKLGSMGPPVEIKYEGRTIKFCCDGCPPQFKADPRKYLKMIDEAAAKLESSGTQWVEGYACPMHPDKLQPHGGPCTICGCGMDTSKWRVERLLSVPETAVIDTGTQQVVYVEAQAGVFEARAVGLGARCGAYYPVSSVLKLGDRIVTRGSFLIDAEARLNPAAAGAYSGAAGQPHGGASTKPQGQVEPQHQH